MTRDQCNMKLLAIDIIYEIEKYKWLESERLGYDIGENIAAKQWISRYYAFWLERYLISH